MAETMAIQTDGLQKYFGDVKAVDGVSISASKGKVVALLGPNGAGKTTIINLLTTQLIQDSGRATVMGFNTVESPKDVRRRLGITFH